MAKKLMNLRVKTSRNYTGTSDKNSYGNEMNHAGNAKKQCEK